MAALSRLKAIGSVGCEVANGIVSPVVLKGPAIHRTGAADTLLIKSKDRQQFNSGDAEFLEVRDLLDDASKGARLLAARGRRLSKTTHMHLVNDGLAHRLGKRAIAFPIKGRGVDDRAAHGGVYIIVRCASCRATPQRGSDAPGVRINQDLILVKAITRLVYVLRTIEAVSVVHASWQSPDIDMPEMESAVCRRV